MTIKADNFAKSWLNYSKKGPIATRNVWNHFTNPPISMQCYLTRQISQLSIKVDPFKHGQCSVLYSLSHIRRRRFQWRLSLTKIIIVAWERKATLSRQGVRASPSMVRTGNADALHVKEVNCYSWGFTALRLSQANALRNNECLLAHCARGTPLANIGHNGHSSGIQGEQLLRRSREAWQTKKETKKYRNYTEEADKKE